MTDAAETTPPGRTEPPADVPDPIREAARAAPDHWFGMVDPAWRGEDAPPNWAVVGRYRSDAEGEVVEWQYNDDYRPSPSAHGWPEPTDEIDEAIQLAATGYGPEGEVFRLLADAKVGIMLAPDGSPVQACSPDGTPVVPVFTSDAQLWSGGRYAGRTVPVRELVRDLDDATCLYVNPAGAVSMTVAPEQLATDHQTAEQPAETTAVGPRAEPATELDDEASPGGEQAAEPPGERNDSIRRVETLSLPGADPEAADGQEPEPADEQAPEPDSGNRDVSAPPVSSTQEHLVNILSGGAG
ncbi:type VII secretion system-associated protein [Streptomyces vietnamensis]|uniref:type VII secretion system-associated protein n=1 Tax=Streptomyces vietnamensis TaxID=362257 RepID=UPI00379C18B1